MKSARKVIITALVLFCIVLQITSCDTNSDSFKIEERNYWPHDNWRTSTPEEQGIDSKQVYEMLQDIRDNKYDIHSFLLIRNGYMVAEAYFDPYKADTKHVINSATKSIVSALLGIAMNEEYVKEVDSKLSDYFQKDYDMDEAKGNITLEQLLTMTPGFPGIDSVTSYDLASKEDAVNYLVDLPLTFNPGESFQYNNASPHLVSAIIKKTNGSDTLFYAQKKLFDPVGISVDKWMTDQSGVNIGGAGLELTPIEMAKFGYLYLRNGVWDNQQIIPKSWVGNSTKKQVEGFAMNDAEKYGYGYFWWMNGFGGYSAHGSGGQYLFVVPKLDLVAVFTANLNEQDFPVPYNLMKDYIIPGAKSQKLLANNETSIKGLTSILQEIENPIITEVQEVPLTAKNYLDKKYLCSKNNMDFSTFSISYEGSKCFLNLSLTFDPNLFYKIPVGIDNQYIRTRDKILGDIFLKGRWTGERTLELSLVKPPQKIVFDIEFQDSEVLLHMVGTNKGFKGTLIP